MVAQLKAVEICSAKCPAKRLEMSFVLLSALSLMIPQQSDNSVEGLERSLTFYPKHAILLTLVAFKIC